MPKLHNIATLASVAFWSPFARFMIRRFGYCSATARFDGVPYIRINKGGTIYIGDRVEIRSRALSNIAGFSHPTIFHIESTGKIVIGANSGISSSIFASRAGIDIGKCVLIGPNCRLLDHDYHSLDPVVRMSIADQENVGASAITIDDYVFIGAGSVILKGVHIGAGSIVGTGSVVTLREVPPRSIVGGNPARIIKTLP
jgi:acetyltransferase-like isoleucine patch superfamily enzyme